MANLIKCFSKIGDEIKMQDLDKDVCLLWKIPQHEENWATPPDYDYSRNWHEFIITLIYFSMPESGMASVDHLLAFYLKEKHLMELDFLDYIKNDIYYISFLLYLKNRGVFFTIQYDI